jgi:hypothetical protein
VSQELLWSTTFPVFALGCPKHLKSGVWFTVVGALHLSTVPGSPAASKHELPRFRTNVVYYTCLTMFEAHESPRIPHESPRMYRCPPRMSTKAHAGPRRSTNPHAGPRIPTQVHELGKISGPQRSFVFLWLVGIQGVCVFCTRFSWLACLSGQERDLPPAFG